MVTILSYMDICLDLEATDIWPLLHTAKMQTGKSRVGERGLQSHKRRNRGFDCITELLQGAKATQQKGEVPTLDQAEPAVSHLGRAQRQMQEISSLSFPSSPRPVQPVITCRNGQPSCVPLQGQTRVSQTIFSKVLMSK